MSIKSFLGIFNLNEKEINLFEKLFFGGLMSASELSKRMGISRTSVYDQVKVLKSKGLLIESLDEGMKKFAVQTPAKISQLVREKENSLKTAQKDLIEIEKLYNSQLRVILPKIQIYKGRKELQQMIKDVLLYRDITLYSYWSIADTLSTLTPSFFAKYHEERANRNIYLKAIWSKDQAQLKTTKNFLNKYIRQNSEVRIAPTNKNFSLGYEIYANKVCFISSAQESYGFIVESDELVQTMKTQHEIIWQISKILT